MDLDRYSKFVKSFFKKHWQLEDYPVRLRHQQLSNDMPAKLREQFVPWVAQIPFWTRMIGTGNTREEAYASLEKRFAEYQAEGNKLPRPGTKVPLQFAPRIAVPAYDNVAEEFFRRMFDVDYQRVFITDQSSLWDFPFAEPNEVLLTRIRGSYGIDISDIEDGNLVRIFQRIEASRTKDVE